MKSTIVIRKCGFIRLIKDGLDKKSGDAVTKAKRPSRHAPPDDQTRL
jgi:hypothetical protein